MAVSGLRYPFGKHQLPINSARSFWVAPYENRYIIQIRFDTFVGNKIGYGQYCLLVDTTEKAKKIVQDLRKLNIRWEMWLKNKRIEGRTVTLEFKEDCEFSGKILVDFSPSLGFQASLDFFIQHKGRFLDLVFRKEKEGEIEGTLRNLDEIVRKQQVQGKLSCFFVVTEEEIHRGEVT